MTWVWIAVGVIVVAASLADIWEWVTYDPNKDEDE